MGILVVDDSLLERTVLSAILNEHGYEQVWQAASAQEALQTLDSHHTAAADPVIDLILMDFLMPGGNGIEACRQIKTRVAWQDIPIIMVTSSDNENDLRAAFEAGAVDYITKPFNQVELLARVRTALALKQEMDRRNRRATCALKCSAARLPLARSWAQRLSKYPRHLALS